MEPTPEPVPPGFSVRRSIAEGFQTVFGSPLLRSLITQSTALNLFFGSFITIFVVYAVRTVHLSTLELGIVVDQAPGGLARSRALLATRPSRRRSGYGKAMAVATIGVSAAPLLLLVPRHASVPTVIIMVAAQLGYGSSISAFNVNAITLRQVLTPMNVLGRMNATYRMVLFGALPVGVIARRAAGRRGRAASRPGDLADRHDLTHPLDLLLPRCSGSRRCPPGRSLRSPKRR